jgi:SAM-dependent methyltransferase
MPSLEENLHRWDREFEWKEGGDEWSSHWGTARAQWHWAILPRIFEFLPASNILEIAPGHGRWTQFLLSHCSGFQGFDLSPTCIEACRKRFSACGFADFQVGDGKSLDAAKSGTVDFVFSFDSLVHAEIDVISCYLQELKRVLTVDGVAFIHHSNLGDYRGNVRLSRMIPRGKRWFAKAGIIEKWYHWRAPSVSAEVVRNQAEAAGLTCLSQELVNWETRRLIDCFTVVTQRGSKFDRPYVRITNYQLMREAAVARLHASIYAMQKKSN